MMKLGHCPAAMAVRRSSANRSRCLLAGCLLPVAIEAPTAEPLYEAWSDQVSASGRAHAQARRVAIDSLGNLIVLAAEAVAPGEVVLTVLKHEPNGALIWKRELSDVRLWQIPRAFLAVDADDAIHLSVEHLPDAAPHDSAYDIRTLVLDADGNTVWQANFGDPDTTELVSDLIVDGSGGTIITGSHHGGEWITIRYDREGTPLWMARHPGLFSNAFSYGWSLALGDEGEIYVSGELDTEVVTVRYSARGDLEWEANAGPGVPGSIRRDPSGAIHVGALLIEDNETRFAILKYDPAGHLLWTFDKPAGTLPFSHTLALIVTDDARTLAAAVRTGTGFSLTDPFLLFAVDPEGKELWEVAGQTAPGGVVDIALDPSGNLLVLGWARGSGTDFTIAKYSESGERAWMARHDGTASGNDYDDFPTDLAVGGDGSVVVVGHATEAGGFQEMVTLKYAPDGRRVFLIALAGIADLPSFGRALAVDGDGTTYVTGSAERQDRQVILVVQYLPDGTRGWTREIGSPETRHSPSAVRVDASGDILVCGLRSMFRSPTTVLFLCKMSRSGSVLWQRTHGDPSQGDSFANALVLDEADNAYVTGASHRNQYGFDWTTVKYDSSGDVAWSAGEHLGNDDEALAIQVDADGSVYVTGRMGTRDWDTIYHTVKYDTAGARLWAASFGQQGLFSEATALAPGPDGGVYVAGESRSPGGRVMISTVRYDPDGSELWASRSTGEGTDCCAARALVVDSEGSAFVTGGGLTRKYSRDGALAWGASETFLDSEAAALDGKGGVFVAGTLDTQANGTDFFLIQYDRDGNTVTSTTHAAPSSTFYRLEDMAVDPRGRVVLTGSAGRPPPLSRILTVKLGEKDEPFHRGDANGDGATDISDGLAILGYLFLGKPRELSCNDAADTNDDGTIDTSDGIQLLHWLFSGGLEPSPPGATGMPCGFDRDPNRPVGDLGCEAYDRC